MLGLLRSFLDRKPRPEWQITASESYEDGLSQAAQNDLVRTQLSQMGDNGKVERHVIHFAYPNGDGSRKSAEVTDRILAQFSVFEMSEGGLRFEETREVASADFDRATQGLSDALARDGWCYDGWECALIKDGES